MYLSQAEQQRCRKVSIDLCRCISRTSLAQPPLHWSALGLILTFEGARSWFDTTAIIGFSETLSLHFSQLQKPRKELNWSHRLLQVYNGPAAALQKMLRQHGRYSHSSNKENPLFVLQLFCGFNLTVLRNYKNFWIQWCLYWSKFSVDFIILQHFILTGKSRQSVVFV